MAELVFDKRPKWVLSLLDSFIMIKRSSTHIVRNTDQLMGTFFQPIMFLVLFSAVFGGAISKALPPGESYLDFLMAGIIVQTLAFGSMTTALAITNDMQKGIVDRFRSLPMSNVAVLNGHVISDLFRNGLSTVTPCHSRRPSSASREARSRRWRRMDRSRPIRAHRDDG